MYRCENCGTEYEGAFCPRCGDVPRRGQGATAQVKTPVRLREWQVALIAVLGAVLGLILLTGVLFTKDRLDQHAFDLKMERLDEQYRFSADLPEPQTPADQSDLVAVGGPASKNSSDLGTGGVASKPSSSNQTSSVEEANSSPHQATTSRTQSSNDENDPADQIVPNPYYTLEGEELLPVFKYAGNLLGQPVAFEATVVERYKTISGTPVLKVSVPIGNTRKNMVVSSYSMYGYIAEGMSITVNGTVAGWEQKSDRDPLLPLISQAIILLDAKCSDSQVFWAYDEPLTYRFANSGLDGLSVTLDQVECSKELVRAQVTIDNDSRKSISLTGSSNGEYFAYRSNTFPGVISAGQSATGTIVFQGVGEAVILDHHIKLNFKDQEGRTFWCQFNLQ